MSIACHLQLLFYAVFAAFLAFMTPYSIALLGHILVVLFRCTDNDPGFTCATPQLSSAMNTAQTLFIVLWGGAWLTVYAAGFVALLLLMSLLFRLGILLVMHILICIER